MSEIPLIRGMRNYDFHACGMIVTEMHEDLKLKEDGFSRISLTKKTEKGEATKYFYFDLKNLAEAEEQAMELWLAIREARKENPRRSLLMKAER